MVAARINFQQGAKKNLKPMETKDKQEYKGKNLSQNSFKGNSNNNKAKDKGVFKGKKKLTSKELERYRKENKCFNCGEQGHYYRSCPQRNTRNEQPRASMFEAPKEDVHCKGSPLSYAWGKVREHDAFILFDPGSTHNIISLELATKLGVQDFDMGDAMKADGAFIGQDVSVTPLIGKLRLHIQEYVDKEDFFISPLKHEDVILGAPWFDRLAASIKFPERKISFKFREKDMYINAQESGSTIPLVNDQAFDKSIKSSISTYMIFIKDSLNGVNEAQVNESGMQEDLELSNFLNQFQDVFIDDIPGELPPKRGDDDHMIEIISGSLPPNKPPYRLATKLGVRDFEMGDAMKADGAFIGQDVSVTPLIGKLRLHIEGYVDKEDFFISPLKHEDVILGAPWFDRLAASIQFPERKISFKFREKDMYINAQESGSTIPFANDQAFDKSRKSSISAYMIFVKDFLNGVNETQVNESGMQEDLELSNFLNQFQDVFIDDIPGELPPKRGDDYMIELIPRSSPPNKPPYRVSQAQQEEIMRQLVQSLTGSVIRGETAVQVCNSVHWSGFVTGSTAQFSRSLVLQLVQVAVSGIVLYSGSVIR
ncbi:hypothetical protein L7F22_060841 [Adiantum nelumboides]|nr:hypothetical protein [Adiantum nelumboides]